VGKPIENYLNSDNEEDDYHWKAKIAIASGKIYGLGPGKSVQKIFYRSLLLILFTQLLLKNMAW
jgi:cell division protein FtsW (lipid II flippase)